MRIGITCSKASKKYGIVARCFQLQWWWTNVLGVRSHGLQRLICNSMFHGWSIESTSWSGKVHLISTLCALINVIHLWLNTIRNLSPSTFSMMSRQHNKMLLNRPVTKKFQKTCWQDNVKLSTDFFNEAYLNGGMKFIQCEGRWHFHYSPNFRFNFRDWNSKVVDYWRGFLTFVHRLNILALSFTHN